MLVLKPSIRRVADYRQQPRTGAATGMLIYCPQRADAKHLEALITGLPMEFRETLVLRDIQGLGYREIAEITGVPVGTVMSRLARARQRLIAALKEDSS